MPRFTEEEKALLAPYVTDTEGDIFAVTGLSGIAGAIYARYSRAKGGFRETLLNEFIKEGNVDAAKAQDLIARVLVAYGDDSVGELEGAHVSFENISVLATKEIEDRRIGGSPIEQSTRYVFYDAKDEDGNFRYFRDPDVIASSHAAAYVETMNAIFTTYAELVEPMKQFYQGIKPIEGAEYDINGDGIKEHLAELTDEKSRKAFRITYNADIRTKACDTLRCLLPLATKTNVGIFGNGRFFQTTLSHCYGSPIAEVRDIARRSQTQLNKVIPQFVKRAAPQEYVMARRAATSALARRLFAVIPTEDAAAAVTLLDRGEDRIAVLLSSTAPTAEKIRAALTAEEDALTLALMLYPHLSHPLAQIRETVRGFSEETKREIVSAYAGDRKTRRDRTGRAFEAGYPYTFDLMTDFGTYKDLMRHRMMTQQRQKFTPTIGFVMPQDLVAAGFDSRVRECVTAAAALYERLLPDFPEAASYATLHGSKVRWTMGINDRALQHMIELRTTPQGHPSYRRVCQQMHKTIAERSPWRAAAMKFADHRDYESARGDAEARQRVKEAALEKK